MSLIAVGQGGQLINARLRCDAGFMRVDGCLEVVEHWLGDPIPPGWVGQLDPFRRQSQLTGEVLVLHLCSRCAAGVP